MYVAHSYWRGFKESRQSNRRKLLPTYPSIPWKQVKGLRDIISHHYFDVDPAQVMWIVSKEISPLEAAIKYFIAQLNEK